MSRIRAAAAVTAVVSLAFAAVAFAAPTKITGGTTQITASAAALTLLSDNHLTVTPVAPATASGGTFTFPISGGSLNLKTLHGVIRHKGGLQISNGTQTVALRQLVLVSTAKGASLDALVRGPVVRVCRRVGRHHLRLKCTAIARLATARIATVTNVKLSNSTATGTLKITAFTAAAINRLAGKQVAVAGDTLGTGTITPTLQ